MNTGNTEPKPTDLDRAMGRARRNLKSGGKVSPQRLAALVAAIETDPRFINAYPERI